jgi:hypothetical protein
VDELVSERPHSAVPATVDLEVIFLGLRRSGNHSVINWLLDQRTGSHAFYNNVWPQNPFLRRPDLLRMDPARRHVDLLVCSFEDRSLHLIASQQCYPRNAVPGSPVVNRRRYVALMRDPFNLFASQLKTSMDRPRYASGLSMAQLYLSYAAEHLGMTNLLGDSKLFIVYNRWKSDQSYRQAIADALGLVVSEHGLDRVPKYGGGSSFEQRRADGSGSQMRTHERWLHYRDDPRYAALFRNRSILEYAFANFDLDDDLTSYAQSQLVPACTKATAIRDHLVMTVLQPLVVGARGLPLIQRLHRTGRRRSPQRA